MTTTVAHKRVRFHRATGVAHGTARLLGEIRRRPGGSFALAVAAGLVFVAIFGDVLAPSGPATQDTAERLQGPSAEHLLGTDHLGRDILSRLIYGVRIELHVALPAVAAAAVVGLAMGLVAGYLGGGVESGLIVVMDTLQAFPQVVLALAVLAVLGASVTNLIIVIAIALVPNYARVTRALVLTTKEGQFIDAERALGAGHSRIMLRHILPNMVAPVFILIAFDVPAAIATEAGLSFLGLGVEPPNPSWGVMLADGFTYVYESPWGIIWPSVALLTVTIGFTMLGEALRDVLDPTTVNKRSVARLP